MTDKAQSEGETKGKHFGNGSRPHVRPIQTINAGPVIDIS